MCKITNITSPSLSAPFTLVGIDRKVDLFFCLCSNERLYTRNFEVDGIFVEELKFCSFDRQFLLLVEANTLQHSDKNEREWK